MSRNDFYINSGVVHMDVSTKKFPGAITRFDEQDLEIVLSVPARWFAAKWAGHPIYATADLRVNDRRLQRRIHRVVMGAEGHSTIIDHADGDGLNNRRSNLRVATRAQNAANSRLSAANSTGFKGVSFDARTGLYRSTINHDGKSISLGSWDRAEMAAAAYDGAAAALFGAFARMNFRRSRA